MKKSPLILICNDDGYKARGIRELTRVAQSFGEVVVVAPVSGQSGMSHAVTLNHPIRYKTVSVDGEVPAYACTGTPADCVKLALNRILDRKPDLVLAGINHGSNASVSLFYSGTVAAVIEACFNGITAAAFSVDDHDPETDLHTAVQNIPSVIRYLLKQGLPDGTCLNVNFPKGAPEDFKGMKVCRQTIGVWKEEFDQRIDPHGRTYYWLTGAFSNEEPEEDDTDEWALEHHYGAIVPVKIDLTDRVTLEEMKRYGL